MKDHSSCIDICPCFVKMKEKEDKAVRDKE